jgi:acetyl esterase/lipase
MSRVALLVGVLLALAAAGAAALIVISAPSFNMALYAVGASEKSAYIIAVAVVAAVLALIGMRPGTRVISFAAILIAIATMIVALTPGAQALRLAGEKRVNLDFGRYLGSDIEKEAKGNPKKTVPYATVDGHALEADVYVAGGGKGSGTTRPIVVVHGGGWSSGDKGDASRFSQWLADNARATVFDIAYRTSPQPNWKAAVGDVKCAIAWVKSHATDPDWNIDVAKVTLLGRSAGGHLALLAAYTPGDPKLPPSCAIEGAAAAKPEAKPDDKAPAENKAAAEPQGVDTRVEAVIAYYAPTDLAWGFAHPGNQSAYDIAAKIRGFVGSPPDGAADLYKLLSPTERVTAAAPRTFLIHGGRDQMIPKQHMELMADKLHAAEVRHETLLIPYAQHGFDFVFGGFSEQIVEVVLLRFLQAVR